MTPDIAVPRVGALCARMAHWRPPYLALWACVLLLLAWALVANGSPQLQPVPDPVFAASSSGPTAAPATVTATACPPRGVTIDAMVVRVIDGDTVVCRSAVEYQVRLIDCWAPESRTRDLEEKQLGLRSKSRMQELAHGRTVRVHMPTDGDLATAITLGRVLGRVWLLQDEQPAEQDLSAIMVSEGFATASKGGQQHTDEDFEVAP